MLSGVGVEVGVGGWESWDCGGTWSWKCRVALRAEMSHGQVPTSLETVYVRVSVRSSYKCSYSGLS